MGPWWPRGVDSDNGCAYDFGSNSSGGPTHTLVHCLPVGIKNLQSRPFSHISPTSIRRPNYCLPNHQKPRWVDGSYVRLRTYRNLIKCRKIRKHLWKRKILVMESAGFPGPLSTHGYQDYRTTAASSTPYKIGYNVHLQSQQKLNSSESS